MIQIVVSCRMSHAGVGLGSYLERTRALLPSAEAFGASLIAWSATTFAVGFDAESIEEAVSFSLEAQKDGTGDATWACGIAEGELELIAANGQRADLAWGIPLVTAVSLSRIARPGEILVDGDVRAFRVGELSTIGPRVSTDAGKRVRGWRLDVTSPWKVAPTRVAPEDDLGTTMETAVPSFTREELESSAVLDLVEAAESPPPSQVHAAPAASKPKTRTESLAARVRAIAHADGPEALQALRKQRMDLESASASARCHASLALGVALALAGRSDEALLEGMDALARARESASARAEAACLAFLAKARSGDGRRRVTRRSAPRPSGC